MQVGHELLLVAARPRDGAPFALHPLIIGRSSFPTPAWDVNTPCHEVPPLSHYHTLLAYLTHPRSIPQTQYRRSRSGTLSPHLPTLSPQQHFFPLQSQDTTQSLSATLVTTVDLALGRLATHAFHRRSPPPPPITPPSPLLLPLPHKLSHTSLATRTK